MDWGTVGHLTTIIVGTGAGTFANGNCPLAGHLRKIFLPRGFLSGEGMLAAGIDAHIIAKILFLLEGRLV